MSNGSSFTLAELLPRLRCPFSGGALKRQGQRLVSEDGQQCYPINENVPDLCIPPKRLQFDLPWVDVWDSLQDLDFEPPEPLTANDLPHHLDAHLASVPGEKGDGRWILEVGCGERQAESYFAKRGFRYVGTDVERRGIGPHVLTDAHNLSFADSCFDFYASMAVYEHLACPLLAAKEAMRVLKPSGTIFGTAAFVYGFHDHASFHHMTHAGILWTLRSVGFQNVRLWPDWDYTDSIAAMGFWGLPGLPWRLVTRGFLKGAERSFVLASTVARRLVRKRPLDVSARRIHQAGSISFVASKPAN